MTVLDVAELSIRAGRRLLVDGVSFQVEAGECVAIVGESGAGKSLTASALVGLLPRRARVRAERLVLDGVDLRNLRRSHWPNVRGNRVGLITQDALSALDPLRRVGREVIEAALIHGEVPRELREQHAVALLESVAVREAERRVRQYPHELSGGLRQRALIASAISGGPALMVADEPTTALDATVQARVLELLRGIVDAGTAMVFISHDFAAVRKVADRVVVLHEGRVVEQGAVADVLDDPQHPHTQALVAATEHRVRAFASGGDIALQVRELSRHFGRTVAVDAVSFDVRRGHTLGIVGESGSGKTTLGRMIVGVQRPSSGSIRWNRPHRVQYVHQDPLAALDPRWRIGRSLREALSAAGVARADRAGRVDALLGEVDLPAEIAQRRPHQLSGGQRQRVAIARALAANPEVLVLDEPVSALDPSVRHTVLDLLERLQRRHSLTMVFISHDLRVVADVCDAVLVMQDGRIVEQGTTTDIFTDPRHAFTQELLAAGA